MKSYNQALVRRGELYISVDTMVNDLSELARMNRDKRAWETDHVL